MINIQIIITKKICIMPLPVHNIWLIFNIFFVYILEAKLLYN